MGTTTTRTPSGAYVVALTSVVVHALLATLVAGDDGPCEEGERTCEKDDWVWCCDRSSKYDRCGDDVGECKQNASKKTRRTARIVVITVIVVLVVAGILGGILGCCCCCETCPIAKKRKEEREARRERDARIAGPPVRIPPQQQVVAVEMVPVAGAPAGPPPAYAEAVPDYRKPHETASGPTAPPRPISEAVDGYDDPHYGVPHPRTAAV